MVNDRLIDILDIAKKDTKFYKEKIIDYEQFVKSSTPLVGKQDLREKRREILTKKYQGELVDRLEVSRTSGSTGTFVEVFWNPFDLVRSNLELWRLRSQYYGIKPTSRYISFHSSQYSGNRVLKHAKILRLQGDRILSFSKFHMSYSDFDEYFKEIKNFKAEWIFTQPSAMRCLLDYIKEKQINVKEYFPKLKYIELNGEICLESFQNEIKNVMNVEVANLYGCNEVNSIAFQCPNGHLHLVDNNVFVKLYNKKETTDYVEGDLLLTSLHNKAMPLIDYDLGDRIQILKSNNCEISSKPIINVAIGRKKDTCVLPSGKVVSSIDFLYCIEKTNESFGNPILKFSFAISSKVGNKLILTIDKKFKSWKKSIIKDVLDNYEAISKYSEEDFSIEVNYNTEYCGYKDRIFIYCD